MERTPSPRGERLLDWATTNGIGFSHFVSIGDSADVDFGDALDYLGGDPAAKAILMYVESVKHARKFMSAARAAARNKASGSGLASFMASRVRPHEPRCREQD